MIRKIGANFGTRIAMAVINFVIAVVVSQFLGAEGKGEQGILVTTIAMVLIFSNIVGGASLVYLTPRHPVGKLLMPAYLWSVLMGVVWGTGFAFLKLIPWEWAPHVAMLSILNSVMSIHIGILLGKEKIIRSNWINFFQSFMTIAALLFFLLVMDIRSLQAYIYALYFAYIFCLILSFILILPLLKNTTRQQSSTGQVIRDLFRFGFMNQLAHIAQVLSFRISYYILDDMIGEKAVGVYSNGVSLMESVWMIAGSIALVQYARISNTDDRKYAQELTARLIRYGLWATFFVVLPLAVLPSGVYTFVFGPEFSGVASVMRWMAPGVLVFTIALIGGHYFSGTGRYYVNALASAAGLIVTAICSFILIPRFAEVGAAGAASISYAVTAIFIFIWFSKETKIGFLNLLPTFRDLKEMIQEIFRYLRNLKTHSIQGHDKTE